jgi:hypothetical protein
MSESCQSAIVLSVDRWGARWLGPYGNSWLETPFLNQFASQSFICEHAIIDSPSLIDVYQSYWQGSHAAQADASTGRSFFQPLLDKSVQTVLVTDETRVSSHPLAQEFEHCHTLQLSENSRCCERLDETEIGQFVASTVSILDELQPPFFLWIHSRGMAGNWDAPYEMRAALASEDDPPPPESTEVPDCVLPVNHDPDELLGMSYAYAGQIGLLDQWFGELLTAIEEKDFGQLLTVVTSPRGFPLGEHRRVGSADQALYGELLQVPLMIRSSDRKGALCRSQALIQPVDLFSTIGDWFGLEPIVAVAQGQSLLSDLVQIDRARRNRAASVLGTERALRTPAWFLRVPGAGQVGQPDGLSACQPELFVKPEDGIEVNNVADRCPDVVAAMLQVLDAFEEDLQQQVDQISELSEVLEFGMD